MVSKTDDIIFKERCSSDTNLRTKRQTRSASE